MNRKIYLYNMIRHSVNIFILFFLSLPLLHAQSYRKITNFNSDWKFKLGNDSSASQTVYDDSKWRKLDLPHDWSIEGNFSKDHPATTQGGALPGGIGWYRKTFTVPVDDSDRLVYIEFDGVYRNSEVWINGHYLGKRPNGYISFKYELTPWLLFGKTNTIAVKADNSQQPNSRWYTGSGIYRDVRLVTRKLISIEDESVVIQTSEKRNNKVTFTAQLRVKNARLANTSITVRCDIYDPAGKIVKKIFPTSDYSKTHPEDNLYHFSTEIYDPQQWSPGQPKLYKAQFVVIWTGLVPDMFTQSFGIRSIRFDRENGFFLNDQLVKIKGVCMHHDLGALGAAFNYRAAERQLDILKEMGCNAIRTAHNPPAPAFLDLCDKKGFLVMDEAFDMWKKKKNKFDYYSDFDEWHKRDLEDLVVRDRNHPSVFMWSIGNEIREQFDSTGISLTKELVSIVKNLDPTRPVTAALTETDTTKNYIYQAHALDVVGWNYNHQYYEDALKRYPGEAFIASETNSALATRGHYDLPADSIRLWPAKGQKDIPNVNGDWSVSAYDNVIAYWGGTHEDTWRVIRKHDYLSGLFVWTGFDYLGEPTPYPWPARSSYFGIVDLAGFPKDIYYMYQSEWTTKPVLHIMPHWNWKPGQLIDVIIYYNQADEVELYLNDRLLGSGRRSGDQLHLKWQVPFEAGVLKAISKKNGQVVLVKEVRTAGKPAAIVLTADRSNLTANKNSLSYVTAKIVDANGNIVPDANDLISFSINGQGSIAATDNGYPADTTSFQSPSRKAWKGLALAIVRSNGKKGNITLKASAAGLRSGAISLKIAD